MQGEREARKELVRFPSFHPMGDKDKKNKVYVAGIASAVTEDALRQFFSFCGPIKSLTVLGYVHACGMMIDFSCSLAC